MSAAKKKPSGKPGAAKKPAPRKPAGKLLFIIEVSQNGALQERRVIDVDRWFGKTVTFGSGGRAMLPIPLSNLPGAVDLFDIGRGKDTGQGENPTSSDGSPDSCAFVGSQPGSGAAVLLHWVHYVHPYSSILRAFFNVAREASLTLLANLVPSKK